ncbi:hypothetical protein [Maritalea sp.]|jgi:2-phosphoglycerate kinase|uniref:hypothetical protein n=1 Tax=Maritalea sp. TaxID=2003361 RepID=UPI0039E28A17
MSITLASKFFGILITGCSHSGKSSLAASLSSKLGVETIHSDDLARHPGRPWPEPQPAVVEFYSSLSAHTVFWLLQAHYQNFNFLIEDMIMQCVAQKTPFIFEGSAIRPSLLQISADLPIRNICLTADELTLRARIQASCNWENLDNDARTIVETFTTRTISDNAELMQTANFNNFEVFRTDAGQSIDNIANNVYRSARH